MGAKEVMAVGLLIRVTTGSSIWVCHTFNCENAYAGVPPECPFLVIFFRIHYCAPRGTEPHVALPCVRNLVV